MPNENRYYRIVCDQYHSMVFYGVYPGAFKRWLIGRMFGWRVEKVIPKVRARA